MKTGKVALALLALKIEKDREDYENNHKYLSFVKKLQEKKEEGEKKTGVQGVSPFALQIQTFQKKERIKGLATKGKITRKKKRESRECPLTILPIVVLQITNSTSMPR